MTIDEHRRNVLDAISINTDWESIDFEKSGVGDFIKRNPKEFGFNFTGFLKNGANFTVNESGIIPIVRGSLVVPHLCDLFSKSHYRSKAITELDLTKLRLIDGREDHEINLTVGQRINRIEKSEWIPLDADCLYTFYEKHLIPKSWNRMVNGASCSICFEGTIFYDNIEKEEKVLSLCGGPLKWIVRLVGLSERCSENNLSAVLDR